MTEREILEEMAHSRINLSDDDSHIICWAFDYIEKLERVIEVAKREVPGKCTCDEAYKSRGLDDPSCLWCDMIELCEALRSLEECKPTCEHGNTNDDCFVRNQPKEG